MTTPLDWKTRTFNDEPHGTSWLELRLAWCLITMERRPGYCDRGRWIAKVTVYPEHALRELYLDGQDGWPRYYFDEERAKAEIAAWVACRKIPTEAPSES
jgi:hypothetical protein